MNSNRFWVIGIVILASVSLGFAGTERFYDGTFNDSDWETFEFNSSGVLGDYESSQQVSGGNPEEFMLTSTNWQGTAQVSRYEQRTGAVYTPQTQGAIDSISYSEDNVRLPNAQATGPAILQNGIIYWADPVVFQNTDWQTDTWTGLTETDFVVPSDPSSHPDFSSAGSSVEFGFFRANSGSGYSGGWISAGIDNWCVSVHSESDVESNLLVNAGFETQVSIPDVPPDHAGYWAADPAIIVSAEQGVVPSEGQEMLRFLSPGGGDPNIWQLIDLSSHRGIISAGEASVSASALFNRINAGDPKFRIQLTTYDGDIADWPAHAGAYLSYDYTDILTDGDLSTWQVAFSELELPSNTTHIGVMVMAEGGFQGHYADDVVVTLVPEPATLILMGTLGLSLLKRRRC